MRGISATWGNPRVIPNLMGLWLASRSITRGAEGFYDSTTRIHGRKLTIELYSQFLSVLYMHSRFGPKLWGLMVDHATQM